MEALLPWVLTAIGAVVSVLAATVTALWKRNNKMIATQVSWREKRIQELEKKEAESEKKIKDLQERVSQLEKERTMLEARFLVFQSSHDSSPLPSWFKDLDGNVLACNKAYEKIFLRPRGYILEDYVGHSDIDVWPEHIAAAFRENDLRVIETGATLDTTETVQNKDKRDVPVRIIKYPRRLHGVSDPIGVAGIAIIEDLQGEKFHA